MIELQHIAEDTIRKLPSVINRHRNMNGYNDVYTTLDTLQKLHQVPSSGTLEEVLVRNPYWYDLADDLEKVLFKMWKSGKTVAAAFICSPYVFTIFW